MARILLTDDELDKKITTFLKRKNQEMHDRIVQARMNTQADYSYMIRSLR